MISYDEVKGTIIAWDAILGLITLENFLEVIDIVIFDQEQFEKNIFNLLSQNLQKEIVNDSMNQSSIFMLKFYRDVIKNYL